MTKVIITLVRQTQFRRQSTLHREPSRPSKACPRRAIPWIRFTDLSALVGSGINTFALQGRLMDRSPVTDPSALVGVGINTFALQGRVQPGTGAMTIMLLTLILMFLRPAERVQLLISLKFSRLLRTVPVSLPIITRPPVASAVPEISTWIMFIIGFVIITLVRWKSKLNYEGRYRVFVKLANKVFLNH